MNAEGLEVKVFVRISMCLHLGVIGHTRTLTGRSVADTLNRKYLVVTYFSFGVSRRPSPYRRWDVADTYMGRKSLPGSSPGAAVPPFHSHQKMSVQHAR